MNKRVAWILLIPFLLASCKKELFQLNFSDRNKLSVQEMDYEYMQVKSKFLFDDGIKKLNANATIRMRKDSIIWASISSAIGVEAVRSVITTDSIFVLDRINKTYYAYSLDSLQKQFKIYVDFNMLQNALLGNLLFERSTNDKVIKNDNFFILNQKKHNLEVSNYVNSTTMKLQKVSLLEKPSMNSLEIDFADFQPLEDNLIPFERSFLVKYKSHNAVDNTILDINFSKVNIDDKKMKFPFNVPGKYDSN